MQLNNKELLKARSLFGGKPGGSGGGDIFYVTKHEVITNYDTDDETYEVSIDKTYAEAVDALNSGKYVVYREMRTIDGETAVICCSAMVTFDDDGGLMFTVRMGDGATYTRTLAEDNSIVRKNYTNINGATITHQTGIILRSSTPGSQKQFRINVDDNGTLTIGAI